MPPATLNIKNKQTTILPAAPKDIKSYNFKIGAKAYINVSATEAIPVLNNYYKILSMRVMGLQSWTQSLWELRGSTWGFIATLDYYEGAYLPPMSAWDPVFMLLAKIGRSITAKDIDNVVFGLSIISGQADGFYRQLCQYADANQKSYDVSIATLEVIQTFAATGVSVTATAIAGPDGGAFISGLYQEGIGILQQGIEVRYNLRDKIDFFGITEDAIVDSLLSYCGDALTEKFFPQLDKMPEGVRKKIVDTIVSFLKSEAAGVAGKIIKTAIDRIRYKQGATWGALADQIVDQFSKNELITEGANSAFETVLETIEKNMK